MSNHVKTELSNLCSASETQPSYPLRLSAAKTTMNVRLSESENGKFISILDLPGDVLVVPQATLGGKAKGKMMQYHTNIAKGEGLELYKAYIEQCHKILDANAKWAESDCSLKHGTYGNRQVLRMDTNGPFSHYFEF